MIVEAIGHAGQTALAMGWEIFWPLVLGFGLSGAIQAVVSKRQMSRLLPDDRPKTLVLASALGAASSSCSYAAVALARALVRKGANFTAAMAFEIASTNLVIEIGLVMVVLLGWRFALAEFVGGPLMIVFVALILRRLLTPKLLAAASAQANQGLTGRMEGHATMHDMSVGGQMSWRRKLFSPAGLTATSHFYVMDWASVWVDLAVGLVLAGAIAAWVPAGFFQKLFISSHPLMSALWGPLIGPLIAVVSFVCSVGNIPLAAVLWNSGISFGGVISFIFADLIVLPILAIYRKYYGPKTAAYLFAAFYIAMAGAGYMVELIFWLLGLTPSARNAKVLEPRFAFNYTAALNLLFLGISTLMVWRFLRTGGLKMLKLMSR